MQVVQCIGLLGDPNCTMCRFRAIMIINVDKQHDKIGSIFSETGGWRWTHMKTRYSLIAHAVSLQRVLYWRVEDESGLLKWTTVLQGRLYFSTMLLYRTPCTVQSLWSNTLHHGPANIQEYSLFWQVPRTLERLTLSPPIPLTLYTLPYWSNPPFLIFDIWALWRSGLSARVPECQKL